MVDCVKSFVTPSARAAVMLAGLPLLRELEVRKGIFGHLARPKGVRRNDALEKLIEGGNSDDLTNCGMVIVGRKTLVEFRLAEIVGNIDACFQK
jgi:hypothetical protein